VLLALDADFAVRGPGGERVVAARDFFTGFFETALGPQDVLTEIRVPKLTTHSSCGFVKFARRAQDWATVGVAAVAKRRNGAAESAAIALVNMGATPLRARAAEQAVAAGEDPGAVAAEGTDPPSDTSGSAAYRRHLAGVLVRRALEEALG